MSTYGLVRRRVKPVAFCSLACLRWRRFLVYVALAACPDQESSQPFCCSHRSLPGPCWFCCSAESAGHQCHHADPLSLMAPFILSPLPLHLLPQSVCIETSSHEVHVFFLHSEILCTLLFWSTGLWSMLQNNYATFFMHPCHDNELKIKFQKLKVEMQVPILI